jgi:hypothetical protein
MDEFGATQDVCATQDVWATLEAWRARGADRVHPARFHFIDALARRARRYDGEARRVLDGKLAMLIAEYSSEIERAKARGTAATIDAEPAHRSPDAGDSALAHNAPRGKALRELVALLESRRVLAPEHEAAMASSALATSHLVLRDDAPDHPMLDYFRETWARFSTDKHLRQSLAQVPDNAGPLNSNSLVHRSLSLMRDLSPGYLRQFLSYVDALSCMEQLAGPGASAAAAPVAATQRPSGAKKGSRGKAR